VKVASADAWAGSSGGFYFNVILRANGTLWSMGFNNTGQLGNGTTTSTLLPGQVGSDNRWIAVSSGSNTTHAIRADRTLWGWGRNGYGQIGDGSKGFHRLAPVQVGSDKTWVMVSGGYYHTIGLKADGTIWAWGDNTYGQIGDGTNTARLVPTQIGSDSNWVAVSAGSFHNLATKSDGTLWAWGRNSYGAHGGPLGDGTFVDKNYPIQVGDTWKTFSAGFISSYAMKADGTIWIWGGNHQGELGLGDYASRTTPVRWSGDRVWRRLAAKNDTFHAIAPEGVLWGSGDSAYGQLGNGTTVRSLWPSLVNSDNQWKVLGQQWYCALAVKSDGTLWAWGRNDYGQLGDGTTEDKTVPKQIGNLDPAAVLVVAPPAPIASVGAPGGPFSPASKTYTVFNSGGTALTWNASNLQPWISLSLAGGTLGPGQSTAVTVSINSAAEALASGAYTDTVFFANLTNGRGNATVAVNLSVTGADMVISALTGPSAPTLPGQNIMVSDITMNQGSASVNSSTTGFFWSSDSKHDPGDVPLAARVVPALAGGALSGPASTTLTVPSKAPGTYYIIAVADDTNVLRELDENNNTRSIAVAVTSGVSTVALFANTIVGGRSLTNNRVTLSGAAPAGGLTVTLASTDPGVVSVPSTVVIPAGASQSPVFTLTTNPVTAPKQVSVWATYGSVTVGANLNVLLPDLSAVLLSPATLVGGSSASGNKVTFTGPVAGATTVMLTSSNPSVAPVPSSVVVAAGVSQSVAFSIPTIAVDAVTQVTISATYAGTTTSAALTVTPPAVSAVVLSPSSVSGGTPTTSNKVTLTGPAGPSGVVVTLTSDRPPSATPPTTVTVPAGQLSSPLFTITTSAVSASTSVAITATYGGASKTANLTIAPVVLSSLTLSPATAVGGGSTTLNTVTLTGPAGPSGAVVTLTSSDPSAATPPATVSVAAGQTSSAVFTISTANVATSTAVTITASYAGVSKSSNLTVNPLALSSLVLSPAAVTGGLSTAANTATLAGPARDGGATVTLTSSNPMIAVVPASVSVSAGASQSPAFGIATTPVITSTQVTISASYGGVTKAAILTVNPPVISSVGLFARSIVGGDSKTGNKVSLTGPAAAGGAIVILTSSNPAIAAVPASVTVAAGATQSPTFTITTNWVKASTPVTISASYGGVTKIATLTVNPPALSSLTLSPSTVIGGLSTGSNRVNLNGPAGPSGVVVTLTSSDPGIAAVPPNVTVVAAAEQSPMFGIATNPVNTTTPVTISATYEGVTKTAALTVNPPALSSLALSPSTVVGGGSTVFNRVNLNGPAGSAGVVVTLTSSHPGIAVVPANVTVAAGQTSSPPFTMTTTPVTASTAVTITAHSSGVTKTVTLTVKP
jgi:alpha-tubulin suppressor-like RCC1 family protein